MSKNDLMGQLLASLKDKPLKLRRGQQISGKIMTVTPSEVILDLGMKVEGVINKKELTAQQLSNVKIGESISAYVVTAESDSGQAIISTQPPSASLKVVGFGKSRKWDKLIQAKTQKRTLKGRGIEVNKGGVVVEVAEIRGFLPISQINYTNFGNLDSLIGQDIDVQVIEVDPQNNRLIFTQRKEISTDLIEQLSKFMIGQKVKGKVVTILPFGIYLNIDGVEGLVRVYEVNWSTSLQLDDLNNLYRIDQIIEAEVIGVDQASGRLNLSIKNLTEDPFIKNASKIKADDVVKGKVVKVTSIGVFVTLKDGVEGLINVSKLEPGTSYKSDTEVTCLVDSVDLERRRINLVPFITSTKGLIYK